MDTKLHHRILMLSLLAGTSVLFLASCSSQNQAASKTATAFANSFEIALLGNDLSGTIPWLGQSLDTSWQELNRLYPSKTRFQITINDIETYDWASQKIILSKDATKRLLDSIDCSSGLTLLECFHHEAFVVALNETPIYGGIFYERRGSQETIDYPVIYPEKEEDKLVLYQLPYWKFLYDFREDHYQISEEDWSRVKNEKILYYFTEMGKIK